METVGVVGLGLMGASLCKALKAAGYHTLGVDIDESTQQYAALTGTVDGRLTDARVGECGFLFIALYPGAAVEWLTAHAPLIGKSAVAVDLCGVKRAVCAPCFEAAERFGLPASAVSCSFHLSPPNRSTAMSRRFSLAPEKAAPMRRSILTSSMMFSMDLRKAPPAFRAAFTASQSDHLTCAASWSR